MKKAMTISLVAVVWMAGMGYAEVPDTASKSTAKTQWINTYSQDNWTDEWPKLICTDSSGYYVVGGSHFRRGKLAYDRMLWVWKLDNEGQRLWSKPLLVAASNDPNKIEWDSNFVCLKNERLVLINETGKKATFRLIRFDETGQITLNKKLTMGGYSHVLRSIVPAQGGYLIAAWELKDTKNTNALVLKIDSDGNELWQKIYDKGKSEDAMSIAVGEDGGFTLAANSGQYNKFGAGPSDVWIVKCDKAGNVLAETLFPGRHPTIAMTGGGHYAVSYSVADFPAGDMYITGLDEKLNKIWEIKSIDKNPGSGIYRIAVDQQGNFVVAGSKFGKLWLWKISDKGAVLWDAPVNNQNDVVQVESLLINGCDYVLAGGAIKQSPMPRDENNKRKEDVQWDINDILVSKITEVNTD
jgi:hypothetical protein